MHSHESKCGDHTLSRRSDSSQFAAAIRTRSWTGRATRSRPAARVLIDHMTCPIQNLTDLQDAVQWLNTAVAVAERALECETSPDTREEWMNALNRKRELLRQLEGVCNGSETVV